MGLDVAMGQWHMIDIDQQDQPRGEEAKRRRVSCLSYSGYNPVPPCPSDVLVSTRHRFIGGSDNGRAEVTFEQ